MGARVYHLLAVRPGNLGQEYTGVVLTVPAVIEL